MAVIAQRRVGVGGAVRIPRHGGGKQRSKIYDLGQCAGFAGSGRCSDARLAGKCADADEWLRHIRGVVPIHFRWDGVRKVHATSGSEAAR